MKRLVLILGMSFLGLWSSIGQTTVQKQRKMVEQPVQSAIETVRPRQISPKSEDRHSVVPWEALRKNKALRNQVWAMAKTANVTNATVSGKSAVKAAVQPPFKCGFDSADELDNKWIVTETDDDGDTWDYITSAYRPTFDGGEESGFLYSPCNLFEETANYLITRAPIAMPAGKAYVAFHHASEGGYVERLRVYYSTDPDAEVSDLTMIGELLDSTIDWKFRTMAFELPEAGDYYFYFLHCSDADQYDLFLDNVEINAGDFIGTPDLRIDKVVLPLSACALGTAETIGARIWNTGTAAITKMSLAYSVNDGTAVTEEITETVAPGERKTVPFTQKADLSAEGTVYTVTVSGTVVESEGRAEAITDNNESEGNVTHFLPVEEFPFAVYTKNEADMAELGFDPEAWYYDEELAEPELNAKLPQPLTTRCMALEAGKTYRFSFDYFGGALVWGMYLIPEDFDVTYGLAGTPMSGWETLRSYEMVYTNDAVVYDEIWFTPKAAGNYSFAITPRSGEGSCNGTLYVSRIGVEAVEDHDVKMAGFTTSLASRTPAQHAVKAQFETVVVNRGLNDEDGVKVTVKSGAVEVGVSSEASIKSTDTGYLAFAGQLAEPAVGSEVTLVLEANMTNTDSYLLDNTLEWTFEATDGLYAYEGEIDPYYDGIGGVTYPFGQIFTLAEPDTLTAVMPGWFDLATYYDESFTVNVELYPVDEAGEAGDCMLAYEFERRLEGGYQKVDIPARVLPAGRYLIALRQFSSDYNMALCFDEQPGGKFYNLIDGEVVLRTNYGNIALQAMFGKAENVAVKDIELLSIAKPRDKGVFAANETIEVAYRNNGHEAMEVEFKCKVGEKTLTSQKLSVAGYGMGTVSFEADMSAVGKYGIEVEAVAADDENPANNVIKKTVECLNVNPYVMDFELCEDFAIEGLIPWTTVDRDGSNTYGFNNTTWPNAYEPQAFIAFNPETVGLDDLIQPHSGKRLGCVFASVEAVNDDWLISPKLLMPAEGAQMEFYVKSLEMSEEESYVEEYEVYVSTLSNNPDDFQQIGATGQAPFEWEKVVVDLQPYAGKEIYLAIRCVSDDQFVMMVDDICVAGGPVAIEKADDLSAYVKSYPNPVSDMWTVTAYGLEIDRVELCDMMGGIVYRSSDKLSVETWRLNMGGFKPGLYVARVYTNAGVQTIKVTVR